MDFEQRLARTVAAVMGLALMGAGCSGGGTDGDSGSTTSATLEGMCDGGPAVEDHSLYTGFVTIDPGGDCPDVAVAEPQSHVCTFQEWQGINCSFVEVVRDQRLVDDGYGSWFVDADQVTTTTTSTNYIGVGPVVDVCYYEGVYYLDPNHPTCGRPLLQAGSPVVAPVASGRSGWTGEPAPVAALSRDERIALAAYWLDCARLEHASVASFARFTLDLMRLGAPPELLAAAQQAGLDEVDHARRCFTLASRYHGEPLGPGALPVEAIEAEDRLAIGEALFREGCVGETLAAVDAAARMRGAVDPQVRQTLGVIVDDESAHAALAWRALRWMLSEDDGSLAAHLDGVFAEEAARWTGAGEGAEITAGMRAHGLLSDGERARELARGWHDVVAPSWEALRDVG